MTETNKRTEGRTRPVMWPGWSPGLDSIQPSGKGFRVEMRVEPLSKCGQGKCHAFR